MTPEELLTLIDTYASSSYGGEGSLLAKERSDAIARYNGELYGDERDGRSHAVSSELRDTIETVVPQLNRIFLGGDQICEFDPETPDDVAGAKQESRYVNFIVTQRNPSFQIFGTWFRDALLCKNGYVKAWWEERSDTRMERYRGLSDDAYAILMSDAGFMDGSLQIVKHEAIPIQQPPMQPLPQAMGQEPLTQPSTHDVEIRRVKTTGYVRFDNVPSEEIRVHTSTRGPDLRDAIFVEHRTNKTLSEIRQMGYEVDDDEAGILDDSSSLESEARDRFDEISAILEETQGSDPSTRRATFRECWMRVDMDGDGIAELRKVCLVNRKIKSDEETSFIPIACITPVIQPHRHVGYGYYDFLKEIERATTAMLRSYFDNLYLANNGRYGVDVNKVNVDDLLISRPGGVVRVNGDPGAAIFPINHPSMGEAAVQGLSFLQNWKKAATGVMADAQSLSADVLNNSTATGISQAISVWQARVEGVARCFAETGMKDLFYIIHALTQQNATQDEKVQIGGEWIQVDPREWVKRTSLTVTVGLGTGSKEAKLMFLQQVAAAQQGGLQIGIAKPENIYETAMEMMKEGGYKDGARFWTDPKVSPPPEPPKDPLVQAEEVKAQVQMQIKPMELQAEMQAADKKAQNDMTIAQQDAQLKAALEQFKAEKQAELERFKAELAAEVELQKANIQAGAQIRAASFTAGKDGEDPEDPEVQEKKRVEAEKLDRRDGMQDALIQSLHLLAQQLGRPKRIVRGPDGRAAGVE